MGCCCSRKRIITPCNGELLRVITQVITGVITTKQVRSIIIRNVIQANSFSFEFGVGNTAKFSWFTWVAYGCFRQNPCFRKKKLVFLYFPSVVFLLRSLSSVSWSSATFSNFLLSYFFIRWYGYGAKNYLVDLHWVSTEVGSGCRFFKVFQSVCVKCLSSDRIVISGDVA